MTTLRNIDWNTLNPLVHWFLVRADLDILPNKPQKLKVDTLPNDICLNRSRKCRLRCWLDAILTPKRDRHVFNKILPQRGVEGIGCDGWREIFEFVKAANGKCESLRDGETSVFLFASPRHFDSLNCETETLKCLNALQKIETARRT